MRITAASGWLQRLVGHLLHRNSASTKSVAGRLQRCGHPGQQHGLRIPPRILSMPTSMRLFLVDSFLADVTQQIHSFRASGVISAQSLLAAALDAMALRKSVGSSWTVPPAIFGVVIYRAVPVLPNAQVCDGGAQGQSLNLRPDRRSQHLMVGLSVSTW
jgi:hypothetical protein